MKTTYNFQEIEIIMKRCSEYCNEKLCKNMKSRSMTKEIAAFLTCRRPEKDPFHYRHLSKNISPEIRIVFKMNRNLDEFKHLERMDAIRIERERRGRSKSSIHGGRT